MNAAAKQIDSISRTLHWSIAALIVAQYGLALFIGDIDGGLNATILLVIHMAVGTVIVVTAGVALLRNWRHLRAVDRVDRSMSRWQRRAAQAMHIALYAILIVLPLTGWLAALTFNWARVGVASFRVTTPSVIASVVRIHGYLAVGLIGLVAIHTLAALYHHYILRDAVLMRMIRSPTLRDKVHRN